MKLHDKLLGRRSLGQAYLERGMQGQHVASDGTVIGRNHDSTGMGKGCSRLEASMTEAVVESPNMPIKG